MGGVKIIKAVALSGACLLSGCAGFLTNAAGIDGAKPVTTALAAQLEAERTRETARASQVRAEQRRLRVLTILASQEALRDANYPSYVDRRNPSSLDVFEEILCTGYPAVQSLRSRTLEMRAASEGLRALAADSPTTIVGLAGAIAQGRRFPRSEGVEFAQQIERNIAQDCAVDARYGNYAFPATIDGARVESIAGAIVGAVDVFKSIIRPTIIAGMTRVDRQRRLEALRAWAQEAPDDATEEAKRATLPGLIRQLQAAEETSREVAEEQRRLAAGNAYVAFVALRDAYEGALPSNDSRHRRAQGAQGAQSANANPLRVCEAQEVTVQLQPDENGDPQQHVSMRLSTECVRALEARLNAQLTAFLNAATAYDTAFDADPTPAVSGTVFAATRLREWLNGNLTPEDAVAVQAAAFAAMEQWLQVLAAAENYWEDAATKKKLSDAAAALRDAFD